MAVRGKPLPFSLREQIREAKRSGETVRRIAALFGLSKTTVSKWTRNRLVQNSCVGAER